MLVTDVRVEERNGSAVLSAEVVRGADRSSRRIHYILHGCPAEWVAPRGDAFAACLLVPAMQEGEDLTIEAPVSPLLLERVGRITDLLAEWGPRLSRVNVVAPAALPEEKDERAAVGLFFTGGVDSFYSLLQNMEEHPEGPDAVTHLLFIHGIGTLEGLAPTTMDRISAHIRGVAKATGKEAIILETNLRETTNRGWMLHHGSAILSASLALSPLLKRCLIASSHGWFAGLEPWGTHPDLDPLWSTETLEIVHDRGGMHRTEKIATQIARSELALSSLRVCFAEEPQPKNCGRCRKCILTMIGLRAAGALDRSSAFLAPLDVKGLWRLHLGGRKNQVFELLEVLGDSSYDRRLARALRFALLPHRISQVSRRVIPSRRVRASQDAGI